MFRSFESATTIKPAVLPWNMSLISFTCSPDSPRTTCPIRARVSGGSQGVREAAWPDQQINERSAATPRQTPPRVVQLISRRVTLPSSSLVMTAASYRRGRRSAGVLPPRNPSSHRRESRMSLPMRRQPCLSGVTSPTSHADRTLSPRVSAEPVDTAVAVRRFLGRCPASSFGTAGCWDGARAAPPRFQRH